MHSLVVAALMFGQPAPPVEGPPAELPAPAAPATLVVLAPREAGILVNGVRMRRSGPREVYQTAPLLYGKQYLYEVMVVLDTEGLPTRDSRRVALTPGRQAEVDFRHLGRGSALGPARGFALVRVFAPPGAAVRVNGVAVAARGKQSFQTPRMEAGRKYYYTVEADLMRDGKRATQRRTVVVEAGGTFEVDFRRP